ncbi:hypothetical protein GCM10023238_00930 [Streptomyces heliomycini]
MHRWIGGVMLTAASVNDPPSGCTTPSSTCSGTAGSARHGGPATARTAPGSGDEQHGRVVSRHEKLPPWDVSPAVSWRTSARRTATREVTRGRGETRRTRRPGLLCDPSRAHVAVAGDGEESAGQWPGTTPVPKAAVAVFAIRDITPSSPAR